MYFTTMHKSNLNYLLEMGFSSLTILKKENRARINKEHACTKGIVSIKRVMTKNDNAQTMHLFDPNPCTCKKMVG
jgi:hypothetical protein